MQSGIRENNRLSVMFPIGPGTSSVVPALYVPVDVAAASSPAITELVLLAELRAIASAWTMLNKVAWQRDGVKSRGCLRGWDRCAIRRECVDWQRNCKRKQWKCEFDLHVELS